MRTPERHPDLFQRLLMGIGAFLVATAAIAQDASLPPEILQQQAVEIILGQVESRTVVERAEDRNLNREITYDVRVEETQKGTLERGAVIKARATTITFMGEGTPPPGPSGHHPLPLVGELARFFLTPSEEGDYLILFPNGVELNQEVSISDPVRRGADAVPAPPAEVETVAAEEPSSKDPFGWDIMLILLGLPILVGGLRQKGTARLGLLGVAMVFFLCAIAIVLN